MIKFKRLPVTKTAPLGDLKEHLIGNAEKHGNLLLGVQDDAEAYPDGTLTAEVAKTTELGDEETEREGVFWLRKSIKAESAYLKKKFADIARVLKGNTSMVIVAMSELGRRMVEKIKEHVYQNDIDLPSNSEATIERKGGDTPMIDTQHMIRQVDYKVVDDGEFS